MSSLYVEETVPVVKLWPHDDTLGELLGGIKDFVEGDYEFIPTHDKWGRWMLPPAYGIVQPERGGEINLQAMRGSGEEGYFESHVICLERHGNMGAALMKMNNIACVALGYKDKPPTGQIKKSPNQDIMVPFWMIEIEGTVSEAVRDICVVFPDDYEKGKSFSEMVCTLIWQRDRACHRLIHAMNGISASSIENLAKH